jgi:hypothetical protein
VRKRPEKKCKELPRLRYSLNYSLNCQERHPKEEKREDKRLRRDHYERAIRQPCSVDNRGRLLNWSR